MNGDLTEIHRDAPWVRHPTSVLVVPIPAVFAAVALAAWHKPGMMAGRRRMQIGVDVDRETRHTVEGRERRKRGLAVAAIVAAFIAVVALCVTGAVLVVRHRDAVNASGQSSQSDEGADAETTDDASTGDLSSAASPTGSLDIDRESMDALVDGVSVTDAAVSVAAVDGTLVYSSRNATRHMVSAGLYLPVYLAYYGTHEQPSDSAGEMMRSMNNEAANLLIDSLGGLDAVDAWLSANQYPDTELSRMFGDVDASDAGYENYASSNDAARMLAAVAASGGDALMTCDIAAEGVDVPEGATVHAHRGSGMQDAYNYFIVISDGAHDVGVSVMTENIGQKRAAQLTSGVLEAVWTALGTE